MVTPITGRTYLSPWSRTCDVGTLGYSEARVFYTMYALPEATVLLFPTHTQQIYVVISFYSIFTLALLHKVNTLAVWSSDVVTIVLPSLENQNRTCR